MELELCRIFVKVVQNGSFSKAGELLKVPKSTVSKAISRLENETGTKLLLRTTRSQTLTAAGRTFYETCLGPVQILEDAQKSLYGKDSIISGRIKLTAPEDLGSYVVAPVIGMIASRNPQLSFELNYTNEVVDLVKDGYDMAIRLGVLSESRLKSKKIGEVVLVPVASPEYLAKNEKIKKPQDLIKHHCLSISSVSMNHRWRFKKLNRIETVFITPKVECNQMTSLLKMAITGGGVAFVPSFLCGPDIEKGRLERVLPDWAGIGVQVSLVSPLAMNTSARLKLVSEELIKVIQKSLIDNKPCVN